MSPSSPYSAEFRTAAVARAQEPGRSVASAAREVGVAPTTLRRWLAQASPPDAAEPPTNAVASPASAPGHERSASARRVSRTDDDHAAADAVPARWTAGKILQLPRRHPYVSTLCIWAFVLWTSTMMSGSLPGHSVVLAVHLLASVAAAGAVFVVEWHGLLWMLGHRELPEIDRLAAALSWPIWGGVAVLATTGVLLKPDLAEPLTWLKLIAVLLLVLNGVALTQWRQGLHELGSARLGDLTLPLRSRLYGSALLSQACWLIALMVGFVMHERG